MNIPNILDCTFRDGGYYNNWNFKENLIKEYFNFIKLTNIKFIEIGFFTIKKNNNFGLTANVDKYFFKKIKTPKNINIGLMINASELLNSENKACLKRLNDIDFKNTKFIRIACHLSEIKKIKKYLVFFRNKKLKIFLNLMQASEVKTFHIKYIKKNLEKLIDCFYFADSFGSMKKSQIIKLSKLISKELKIPFGIHSHDNMKLAFKNTINANKSGASWVDGTILGMGRGPGNTKTEELILKFYKKNFRNLIEYQKIIKSFKKLKTKYQWGPNIYYNYSGEKKIHPTYVQKLLYERKVNKQDYFKILYRINKTKLKKFDPNEFNSAVFYFKRKNVIKNIDRSFLNNYDKFLIVNSNFKIFAKSNEIMKILADKKTLKILVNKTENKMLEKYCNMISFCHPLRLMSLNNFNHKSFQKILVPLGNIPDISIKFQKSRVIDYPIFIKPKLKISKKFINIPDPLTLIYTISFLVSSSIKNINLLGFEGYQSSEVVQDRTQNYITQILKTNKKINITSLSKTNFKLQSI